MLLGPGFGVALGAVSGMTVALALPRSKLAPLLAAGIPVATMLLALRPLGMIRALRRYALVAVVAATIYFLVQFGRHPLPALNHGSWTGFWLAADALIAVSVSWVPLAADYSRHSRSTRSKT